MKKNFLIPFLIVLALLMVTSCKKKEDPTNIGPVVTVAQEKNYEPKTLDKEIPMLTVNENNKEEVKTVNEATIVKESNEVLQIDFTMLEKESLLSEIANIEVMTMTPLDAMNTLFKIVQDAKKLK